MKIDSKISSIAIGSFDGLHTAHQALIKHSQALAVIEHSRGRLTHGFKRSWYTNKPIFIFMLEKIKNMDSKEFIEYLNYSFPNLKKIIIGYDFGFGKNRDGGVEDLKRLFDGEVLVVDEVKLDNISIHSQTIQEVIAKGDIELANRMLGRNYRVDGYQIRGQGLGKREFVPTINLKIDDSYIVPKEGVYASFTEISGMKFKSITFLGHRFTTDGSFAVETHILEEFDKEPKHNERIFIEFVEFIRENREFDSFKELKKQILLDINRAEKLLT